MHSALSVLATNPGIVAINEIGESDIAADGLYNFGFATPPQIGELMARVEVYSIVYLSDALPIHGFVAIPKDLAGHAPLVMFNRGGNNFAENHHCKYPPHRLGRLTAADAVFALGRIASWGYVVAASQYRGCYDLSQGDEIGAEVSEIATLKSLLSVCPAIDTNRTAIVAYSRGAVGAFLLAAEQSAIRAIVSVGGLTDYPVVKNGLSLSPLERVVDLSLDIKVLLLQGALDDKTPVAETEKIAERLSARGIETKMVLFPNGTHYLEDDDDAAARLIKNWLCRHL